VAAMIRLYIDQGMDGVKGVLSIQSVIDENDGEVKARRDLSIQLVQSTSTPEDGVESVIE